MPNITKSHDVIQKEKGTEGTRTAKQKKWLSGSANETLLENSTFHSFSELIVNRELLYGDFFFSPEGQEDATSWRHKPYHGLIYKC